MKSVALPFVRKLFKTPVLPNYNNQKFSNFLVESANVYCSHVLYLESQISSFLMNPCKA
ncbi:Uncharacterised protein [Acinetobacter baumannii]|nr:Uncharacterised protein [Acinetobacter baumannii]